MTAAAARLNIRAARLGGGSNPRPEWVTTAGFSAAGSWSASVDTWTAQLQTSFGGLGGGCTGLLDDSDYPSKVAAVTGISLPSDATLSSASLGGRSPYRTSQHRPFQQSV